MICENCNIVVDHKFEHAIRSNSCPGCGKHIMASEKLASYMSLQELIKNNFSDISAEKVANLVVANFELKQLFKESKIGEPQVEIIRKNKESKPIEVSEGEMSDEEYDKIAKQKQIKDAKNKLKKMKEEAYEDALRNQYGMGDIEDENDMSGPNDFFSGENMKPIEIADRMKQSQKQQTSKNGMLSGAGGFTRSDG